MSKVIMDRTNRVELDEIPDLQLCDRWASVYRDYWYRLDKATRQIDLR
jgi:hypothetical protein